MTGIVTSRPHFRRPPILEQAITVAFERIADFDAVDFGLFWSTIRDEFPRADTTPKAQVLTETFEHQPASISMRLMQPVELLRSMFRNDGGELVQLQEDRFGFNWIKSDDDSPYPRYDATRKRFLDLYSRFIAYVHERYQVEPKLQQCEITNVNIVPISDFGRDFTDINVAFNVDTFELGIEGVVSETYFRQRQFRIDGSDGMPIGRLHLTINPVFRVADQDKAFNFELTARSAPTIGHIDDAIAFFDRAHNVINSAFMATVTPTMCELWEQIDGEQT